MKLHRTIAAGTALALLMAAPLAAAPLNAGALGVPQSSVNKPPMVLAQASIEELRQRLKEEGLTDEERAALQAQIDALEKAAPAEEAAPKAEEPAPKAEEPAPKAEEPAPKAEEPAPKAEEPAPKAEEPAPKAEEPAPKAEEPAPKADEPAPKAEEPAPKAEEPAPKAEKPAPKAEEPAPKAEEPAPKAEEPAPKAEEPAPKAEEPAPKAEEPAPKAEEPAPKAEEPAPKAEEPAPKAEEPAPKAEEPAEKPRAPAAGEDAAAQPENAAPILDSQKEAEQAGKAGDADAKAAPQPAAKAAPPPKSDADAQAQVAPEKVESATAAKGKRVDEKQADARVERRSDAEVIGEIAGRILLSLGGRTVVQHDDHKRLRHNAQDVYYEELPRGRTRETIVRRNGAKVVTIRDRHGDVIRRSRITPDGREYVLVYAGDRDNNGHDEHDRDHWRDPGRDLPPLRLSIPANEYILDARRVDNPDRYYKFLDQPPVEPVRRLYSVDEVKYSARIRDSVRRVDLDNITFDFGSAAISQSEVAKLEGVANAMTRLLKDNPAETFLIEGHTDAVGTDDANLALSDQRAESVAAALTDVFDIPPENLVTQGYGEAYLKVETEEPNRTNRRVAVRRITPLVSPVASR